jgi:hypothetical protein
VKREKPDYYDALEFDNKRKSATATPTRSDFRGLRAILNFNPWPPGVNFTPRGGIYSLGEMFTPCSPPGVNFLYLLFRRMEG